VLTASTPSRDLLPLVAEGLVALGGTSVLEDGDAVSTFLPPPDDADAFADHARALLSTALPTGARLEVQWRWQPQQDWIAEWKRGLGPRRVTERLTVKPTWCDVGCLAGRGRDRHRSADGVRDRRARHHPWLPAPARRRAIRPGDRVLDVGSGSAVLAIAAARLGADEVIALEYDPDANLNARENLELNGVKGRVRIVEAIAEPDLLAELGIFDLIVANILSSVIRPLLPAFHDALGGRADGRLIVSGILRAEHEDVVRDAVAAGFRVAAVDVEEDWWSALLQPD
jgi:ribosomal protein L11 methyltransferase